MEPKEILKALRSPMFSHLRSLVSAPLEMRVEYIEIAMKALSLHDIDLDEEFRLEKATNKPGPQEEWITLSLEEVEMRHILAVMNKCHGSKTKAAKILGINIKTLYNKLVKWGHLTPLKEQWAKK